MTNIPGLTDLKLRLTIEGRDPNGDVVVRDVSAVLAWTRGEEKRDIMRALRVIAEQLAAEREPANRPLYPEEV